MTARPAPHTRARTWLRAAATAAAAALLAAPAAAQTTRINVGTVADEAAGHHSWLAGHSPQQVFSRPFPDFVYDIRDDEFASWIYGTNIGSVPHSALLFTMGQCHASGFMNDLVDGNQPGQSIGFAAAANWDECSFSTAAGNSWLQPWGDAVDAPHPLDDAFLAAFNVATMNDPQASALNTHPQYYGFDADAQTLNLGGGNNNFFLLYVGDTYGRPDFFLDIDQIHRILTTQYGATEAQIIALYGDGVRRDAANNASPLLPAWIDGAGTKAQLQGAINNIGGAFVPNDGFFFWSSNHGLEGAGITTPEPATVALTAGGVLLLALVRRRRA